MPHVTTIPSRALAPQSAREPVAWRSRHERRVRAAIAASRSRDGTEALGISDGDWRPPRYRGMSRDPIPHSKERPVASIGTVQLDIQKIPNNLDADVQVTYTVTFDASDRDTNRRYDEVVELVGVDDGLLNTGDEVIGFGVGKVPFFAGMLRADGRDGAQLARTRRVERRDLNEDKPGRDEIRARVILTSAAGQVSRESNLVIDDFNPAHA
jgi:hypothetical protein